MQAFPEWRDWFALPFIKNPELQPMFETYFTRAWLDTFTLSLHNFLSTMFHNLPLPTLLSFDEEQIKFRAMGEEIESLRTAAWQDSGAGFPKDTTAGAGGAHRDMSGSAAVDGSHSTQDGDGAVVPPPYSSTAVRQPRERNAPTPVFTLSGTEAASPEPQDALAVQYDADDNGPPWEGNGAPGIGAPDHEDESGDTRGDAPYSVRSACGPPDPTSPRAGVEWSYSLHTWKHPPLAHATTPSRCAHVESEQ